MTHPLSRAIRPVAALAVLALTAAGCGADPVTAPATPFAGAAYFESGEIPAPFEGVNELPVGQVARRTPAPTGVSVAWEDGRVVLNWRRPAEPYTIRVFWNDALIEECPAEGGTFVWAAPRMAGPQSFAVCFRRSGIDGPATVVTLDVDPYAGETETDDPAPIAG